MFQKTFLYKVFRADKPLFVLFVAFIAGSLYFFWNPSALSTSAAPHSTGDSYMVYSIIADETTVRSRDFFDAQRRLVYNTLAAYDRMKQNNLHDHTASGAPADMQIDTPYQKWLFQYIADMRMVKTPVIETYKQQVGYSAEGKLIPSSPKELLFKLRDE